MHEASLYSENCFLTLTYSPENIPTGNSLLYSDFQTFLRRLRKLYPQKIIRFYMCGEYGESNDRPHYHACIFNHSFSDDKKPWRATSTSSILYLSPTLSKLWPHGYASIGDLTLQSAGYTARYIMAKITGDLAESHYQFIDSDGVVHSRVPEFNRMSLKPGIGARWAERYASDVYPHDYVISRGFKNSVPAYYDKLLKRRDFDTHEAVKEARALKGHQNSKDNTPQRLQAKETVQLAKIQTLTRKL